MFSVYVPREARGRGWGETLRSIAYELWRGSLAERANWSGGVNSFRLALRPEPRPKARRLPTRFRRARQGAEANRIRPCRARHLRSHQRVTQRRRGERDEDWNPSGSAARSVVLTAQERTLRDVADLGQ